MTRKISNSVPATNAPEQSNKQVNDSMTKTEFDLHYLFCRLKQNPWPRFTTLIHDPNEEEISMKDLKQVMLRNKDCDITFRNASVAYVQEICKLFDRHKIGMRFSWDIGSCDSAVLRFWNTKTAPFEEYLRAIELADSLGHSTIVLCSPPLDDNLAELVELLSPFTDYMIIEIPHTVEEFLIEYGFEDPLKVAKAKEILKLQSTDWLLEVGAKLRENPVPWWDERTRTFLDQQFTDIKV